MELHLTPDQEAFVKQAIEARIGSQDSDAPPRLDGRVKPGHDEPEKARPS